MTQGAIRVGVGGWDYHPWRESFYPPRLPKAKQLEHMAARLTAIEINATHRRLFKPENFARWAGAAPPGFVFAVKASRYCTGRAVLAEAAESIERFVGQGLVELGDKLGPILWRFMATRRFDPDDFEAFLAMLPASHGGVPLRHAVEVGHDSFRDPAFADLARKAGVAIAWVDSDKAPVSEALTAGFAYARLKAAREEEPTGYAPAAIDRWTAQAKAWAATGRDAFLFVINGAKVRAPAAAQALIARIEVPDSA